MGCTAHSVPQRLRAARTRPFSTRHVARFCSLRSPTCSTVRTGLKLQPSGTCASGRADTMASRMEVFTAAAEITSAVAVVISLALLISSIRENTAVLRATAAADSRDSLASMNDLDLQLGEKHFDLILRSGQPSARPGDFSELELAYLKTSQRSFFRRAEAQYFRYRNGLLDDDAWQTVRYRVWLNIQSPVESAIWRNDREHVYTRGFVEAIETYARSAAPRAPRS